MRARFPLLSLFIYRVPNVVPPRPPDRSDDHPTYYAPSPEPWESEPKKYLHKHIMPLSTDDSALIIVLSLLRPFVRRSLPLYTPYIQFLSTNITQGFV